MKHGNRLDSDREQVLYVVYDHEERFIWYFGITCEVPGVDNLTDRIKRHVKSGNRFAGYKRYTARILRSKIPKRLLARGLEDSLIRTYRAKHGEIYPRGNGDHPFLSEAERAIHDAMIKLEEE